MLTGYLHPEYARSLADFGVPTFLSECKGWILQRQIPRFSYYDAMGCYPIFCCEDWSRLHIDLENVKDNKIVALSIVTDPFGMYSEEYLRQCFKDIIIPFKDHFVVDLTFSMESFISKHHCRYSRKSLKEVRVELYEEHEKFLDEWVSLYDALIDRHNIKGLAKFSPSIFFKQFNVPGLITFGAIHQGKNIGMILWYKQGDVAYYHLGAYNDLGYKMRASFALFWRAIEYFKSTDLKWLDLGAGAGVQGNLENGLSYFKRGWSTGTRIAYFCGRIFDHDKYQEIVNDRNINSSDYFPKYRMGEFT